MESRWPAESAAIRAATRVRVADQIIDTLRDKILTSALPRGSKLPTERELAAQFKVSSPTIREALRALTSLGLVEVRHGSGAYVTTNSDGILRGPLGILVQLECVGVEEIIGLVQVLNLYAADLAVTVADGKDIQRVRLTAERTAQCKTINDVQEAVPAFLVALSSASSQPLLESLCGFLADMLVRLETSSFKRRNAAFWCKWASGTAPMRIAIADALADRDRAELRAALTRFHNGINDRVRAAPALRAAQLSDPALSQFTRGMVVGPGGN